MKTLLFFVLLLCLPGLLFSQEPTKLSFSLFQKTLAKGKSPEQISLYVKGDEKAVKQEVEALGGTFKYAASGVCAIRLPIGMVSLLASHSAVKRIEDAMPLEALNDRMLINNDVVPVQIGTYPLVQGYDGTGVVVGIIDTGIDFNHPDFKDTNGKTRIKFMWDHYLPDSAAPQPYGYGQEWRGGQIDSGQASAHYPGLHGTHVSGIAAGNGFAVNNYKGVAPGADIVAVTVDFNKSNWLSTIVDATDYIYKKAKELGKPCVINASVGTYYGSHDGKDLEAQLMDGLITQEPGRVFVCAAGNAGSVPIHLGYTVTSDTLFTWFNKSSGVIYIPMWADTADFRNVMFALGADKPAPSWGPVMQAPFHDIFYYLNTLRTDTLYEGSARIGIVQSYGELVDDRYSMEFVLTPDSTSYNWRLSTTGTGKFDAWSFDMLSSNLPDSITLPAITRYRKPDYTQSTVSSFSCSPYVITVGNYINRSFYTDVNGNMQTSPDPTGSLAANSSKGPTRDGRTKPDITATGTWLLSSCSLPDVPPIVANEPWKIAPGAKHINNSGTSMASPVVTGIAALYLQQNPNASYADVKNALITSAKQDAYTGYALPDNSWGYGKVDAFRMLAGPLAVNEFGNPGVQLYNYPNPFDAYTYISYRFNAPNQAGRTEIRLTDVAGRLVKTIPLKSNEQTILLEKNSLQTGLYFYSLIVEDKVVCTKKLSVF